MLVICPIFDRCELLPFYLRHYTRLGASRFVLALWDGPRNPQWDAVQAASRDFPVTLETSTKCSREEFNGPVEAAGIKRLVAARASQHEWYCIADLDEFCYFGGRTMPECAQEATKMGYSALHGRFVDRVAADGTLPEITPQSVLDDLFPMQAAMSSKAHVCQDKVPMALTRLGVESGHHKVHGGGLWKHAVEVHHFKWTAGLQERLKERAELFLAQGLSWYGESTLLIDYLAQNDYRLDPSYQPARKLGL
jgi:hypothetical protein